MKITENLIIHRDTRAFVVATLEDIDTEISLTGAVPWSNMILQNNWVKWTGAAGYGSPMYRKHPGGIVELKGIINRSTGVPGFLEDIARLPLSVAPAEGIFINCTSQVNGADAPGNLLLQSTGQLQFRGGGGSFMALSPLVYGVDKATAVFFGDSNTYGSFTGSTVTNTQRFSYLISQQLNLIEDNEALCGTVLQNTSVSTQPFPTYSTMPTATQPVINPFGTAGTKNTNGFDSYDLRIISEYPDYVYIMYGLNDMRWVNGILSTFQTQLDSLVADCIKKRINPNRILLANIPYIKLAAYTDPAPWSAGTQTKHLDYNTVIRNIAKKYQVKYADVYTQILNNGGDTLLQDNIHMNAAGHIQIQTAFNNATVPIW